MTAILPQDRPTLGKFPSEAYVTQAMPGHLGTFDMLMNYIVILFNITISTSIITGGPAGLTYLLIGSLTFFFPCAVVTAQLAVMFPNAGALYNWSHHALGGFWSFFSGFCAWLSGILIILAGPNLLIAYLQFMHPNWLSSLYEQAAVIIGMILFAAVLAVQRSRVVQNVVNAMTVLLFLAVPLIGFAGSWWLVTGHPSATNFSHPGDWGIQPANLALFGTTTFAYLSTEVPLNLSGELRQTGRKRIITRHLLWGTILVFLGYLISSWAMLVVQGPNAGMTATALYTPVTTVEIVLGKGAGELMAFFVLCYFAIIPTVFNAMFSRLLLVGSIDQFLPVAVGRLNKDRVPTVAIQFQTILIVVLASVIFLGIPLIFGVQNATNFTIEVYNVVMAGATLIWALSVVFLFIDLLACYLRDRQHLDQHRLFPMPVLWVCIVVGPLSCLTAIVGTLYFSWIPTLIPTNQWWLIVSGLTICCILIAILWGLYANSQARFEQARFEHDAKL